MKEITVEAVTGSIEEVTDFINGELEALDCPMKAQIQLDIAIDELFGNIARYAYPGKTGKATVRFEAEENPLTAVITFIDSGIPFNPLKTKEPDTKLSAEQRKIGGLGIFLVKKTMDSMEYRFSEGQNILTIKKKLL